MEYLDKDKVMRSFELVLNFFKLSNVKSIKIDEISSDEKICISHLS